MKRFTSTLALFLLLAASADAQQIIYVNSNASEGTNDGTSWGTAYFELTTALSEADSGDQIWVADGIQVPNSTYNLPSGNPRNAHYEMKNGVEIYGGFEGTETAVSQRVNYRRGEINETVLSGDIGIGEDNSDNCFHVIYNPESLALDSTAVLDGFTIVGGKANEIGSANFGNLGGGMFNDGCSPIVRNCTFFGNAAVAGAGMYNDGPGSPTLFNCVFQGNAADITGGGVFNGDSLWFSAFNCLFFENSAGGDGAGGIYNGSELITLVNCTIYNNTAVVGGMLSGVSLDPLSTIKNTIFWGNNTGGETPEVSEIASDSTSNFTYCCIRGENSGTYSGTGNIFVDPLFTGGGEGGVPPILGDESPCIGAGTATDAPLTDILGITRGTPPDMGAYENGLNVPLPVEMTSFTVQPKGAGVELVWRTAMEVNNFGFEIQRSEVRSQKSEVSWLRIGFVEGSGTTNSPKSYSFTDAAAQGKVVYRLKQVDNDGKFEYSSEIEVTAGQTPQIFALMQNFPNPFNPTTEIRYQMPDAGMVSLKIYDMLGREVQTLVNEVKEAGEYRAEFTASHLASGIYFYTLQTNNFTATKKMLLVK